MSTPLSPQRALRHGLAWAAVLLLALLIVQPPLGGDVAVGHPLGDMLDHCWGTRWFGSELLAGRWPSRTTLIAAPAGGRLWYPDPLGALLALPLRGLGPGAAYSWLLACQAALAGLAAYAVGLGVSRTIRGGLLAAVAVVSSPYLLGAAGSGLSELVGLALPLLFVGAALRAVGLDGRAEPSGPGWAVGAGVLLGASAVQTPYYAVFGGLLLLCLTPGPGWLQRLRPTAIIAGTGLLLAAPWLVLSWQGLHAPDSIVQPGTAPGWLAPGLPPVDLAGFVVPGDHHFPDLASLGNPGIVHVHYLGWVALGLAAWVAWHQPVARRLLLPTGLFFLLCLGPELRIAGWSTGLPLPMRLAYIDGSPLAWIHHPYRMVALLLPMLAGLVALAGARLNRRVVALAMGAVLLEALLLSPAPWPLARTSLAGAPEVYARLSGPGAVLDWPPDATTANRWYLRFQLVHERPIAYGVNVFLPEPLRRDPLVADLLHLLDDPVARARNRDIPLAGPLHLPAEPGPSHLAEQGFGLLALHRQFTASGAEHERSRARIAEELGEPELESHQVTAWRIP